MCSVLWILCLCCHGCVCAANAVTAGTALAVVIPIATFALGQFAKMLGFSFAAALGPIGLVLSGVMAVSAAIAQLNRAPSVDVAEKQFKERQKSVEGLMAKMGRGLLVTELLGHGINYVTGDYSRGAAGYWIEDGKIAYPVEEITIAGNLKAMLAGIVAVGNDVLVRGSKQTGSIMLDRMTVAGE